jgi:hypothetical protein
MKHAQFRRFTLGSRGWVAPVIGRALADVASMLDVPREAGGAIFGGAGRDLPASVPNSGLNPIDFTDES